MIKLEICCASAEDAVNAYQGGADRVELNSAIAYGGLTANLAELKWLKSKIKIPIMVMIRPRSGGFCYTETEFEIMKESAKMAVDFGADGLVFGILDENGEVDLARNRILKEIAKDKITVFHRAFDITPDPFTALEKIKQIKIDRILTSAQANKVETKLKLAARLIALAGDDLDIVLAGGIRDHNISKIINQTKAKEVHLSAFSDQKDLSMAKKKLKFNSSSIAESKYQLIDSKKVIKMKKILENLNT